MIHFSKRAIKNPASLLLLGAILALMSQSATRLVVRAEGAALLFSPSSGTYSTGKTFAVKVVLNSGGGVGVNAADGTVSYDPSVLSVVGVNKDNSIFSLWTSEPTFSNSKGTVSFSGGSPAGFTKDGGTVVTITFRPQKAGVASVSFSNGTVLAADGKGTNVLSQMGKANFTVSGAAETPPPAAAGEEAPAREEPTASAGTGFPVSIDISSPTHPDQEKWYANRNPEFKWKLSADLNGISAILSPRSDAAPPRTSEGEAESKKFEDVADGTWYFAIRFKSQSGGWSQIVRRKVLIDTAPPESFSLGVESQDSARPPRLLLAAVDKTSGIDRYEAKVDDREAILIATDKIVDGTYILPPVLPGTHRVTVKAFDKAGNSVEDSKSMVIEGRGTVDITNVPSVMEESERLIVEGLSDMSAKVIIKIEGNGKVVAEESVKADDEGKWVFAYRKSLRAGEYEVAAKMITRAGAESGFTQKVPMLVNPSPFMQRYGGALVMLLLFVIIGLVFYGLSERKEILRRKEATKREVEEAHRKAEAVFAALHEEMEEKVKYIDEAEAAKAGVKKLTPLEVQERLREALDISEDALTKEIEDVEKTLI